MKIYEDFKGKYILIRETKDRSFDEYKDSDFDIQMSRNSIYLYFYPR